MDILSFYKIHGLESIVTEAEVALKIEGRDYEETDFNRIMADIKKRINKEYQIDLNNGKVNDISFETGIYKAATSLFLDTMSGVHMKLAAEHHLERYQLQVSTHIAKFNWLGYTRESLLKMLKHAQTKKHLPQCEKAIISFEQSLGTINFGLEKRLIMIMCVCYEIGVYEIVSVIAEILYLGGRYES